MFTSGMQQFKCFTQKKTDAVVELVCHVDNHHSVENIAQRFPCLCFIESDLCLNSLFLHFVLFSGGKILMMV